MVKKDQRVALVTLGGIPDCAHCDYAQGSPLDDDYPESCTHPNVEVRVPAYGASDPEDRVAEPRWFDERPDPRPDWCPLIEAVS